MTVHLDRLDLTAQNGGNVKANLLGLTLPSVWPATSLHDQFRLSPSKTQVNLAELSRSSLDRELRSVRQPLRIYTPTKFQFVFVFVHQRVSMKQDVVCCRPCVRHITHAHARVKLDAFGPSVGGRSMGDETIGESIEQWQLVP